MSFVELLNNQINSLNKTLSITCSLIQDCFDRTFFGYPNASQDKSVISEKMLCAIRLTGNKNFKLFEKLVLKAEDQGIDAIKLIEKVLEHSFRIYDSSWYFVVVVFTILDSYIYKEYQHAQKGGYAESYLASSNSKRAQPICNLLRDTINMWVFFNGGWQKFVDNYDYNSKIPNNIFHNLCSLFD